VVSARSPITASTSGRQIFDILSTPGAHAADTSAAVCDDRRDAHPATKEDGMIRKRVRAVMLLIAGLLIPVAALAGPLPADAAANHLCEAFGSNHYCVGSVNLDLYTHLDERKPGREISTVPSNGTFKLRFDAGTTKCVASANDGILVDIRPCNGTGVVWDRIRTDSGNYLWVNEYASNYWKTTLYLTGNDDGSAYYLTTQPAPSGAIQQFRFS
jgi:hypothetical protein